MGQTHIAPGVKAQMRKKAARAKKPKSPPPPSSFGLASVAHKKGAVPGY